MSIQSVSRKRNMLLGSYLNYFSWPIFISLFFRLSGVGGKFILTFFMAKYMPLEELGTYGLAYSCVMFSIVVFGGRLDYVLAREMLTASETVSIRALNSSLLLFSSSFLLAIIPAYFLYNFLGFSSRWSLGILIYLLCFVESLANFFFTLTAALDRATHANGLFFIRSGLSAFVAVGISFFYPSLRSAEFILACWLFCSFISLTLNLVFFKRFFKSIEPPYFDFEWLKRSLAHVALIWIGSVGLNFGGYIDRFIMVNFLSLEDVGVATFYLSFTLSILNLVQSSTMNLKFSFLAKQFEAGEMKDYKLNYRFTSRQALMLSGLILLTVSICVPFLLPFLGKMALNENLVTLYLLLLSAFIRTEAESLYYALYIEHKDQAVWKGNLLFLFFSCAFNIALIPIFNLQGIGWAAILSALVLLLWRSWSLKQEAKKSPVSQTL